MRKQIRSILIPILEGLPVPLRAFILWLRSPKAIVFEVTNICNLRCPLCPSSSQTRQLGYASFSQFQKLIEQVKGSVRNVSFYLLGEPLLNKELFDMVRYAEALGIKTTFSTNDMLLKKYIKEIFDSGLSSIQVTLDGLNSQDHESYRIGSNYDTCVEGICALITRKQELGSKKPIIKMQSLLFKHNEGREEEFSNYAKALGVDIFKMKKVTLGRTEEKIEMYSDKYMPSNSKLKRQKCNKSIRLFNAMPVCPQIRDTAFILWNGDVVPCCFDPNGTEVIGNASGEKGFKYIWYSKKRYDMLVNVMRHTLEICSVCDGAIDLDT